MASAAHEDLAARVHAACLGTRVSRLHRQLVRRYDAALRPLGMTVQQMEVLTALHVCDPEPARPAQLATWLSADRSTISRNLASLTERGWVAPATTSPTGRALAVRLTDAGRDVYAQAEPLWQAAQDATLDELGPASVSTLDGWLERLHGRSEREAGRPPR